MTPTKAHHVYALLNPRNRTIFYIGKGQGKRSEAHVIESNDSKNESDKLSEIRRIRSNGNDVDVIYLAKGYKTDKEAKAIEALLIETARHSKEVLGIKCELTNIQRGEHYENVRPFGLCEVNEMFDLEDSKAIEEGKRLLFDFIESNVPIFNLDAKKTTCRVQTKKQSNDFEFRVFPVSDTLIYFEYLYFQPSKALIAHRQIAKSLSEKLSYSLKEKDANVRRRSRASHISQHEMVIADLKEFIATIEEAL
jgi:hypothetical protein